MGAGTARFCCPETEIPSRNGGDFDRNAPTLDDLKDIRSAGRTVGSHGVRPFRMTCRSEAGRRRNAEAHFRRMGRTESLIIFDAGVLNGTADSGIVRKGRRKRKYACFSVQGWSGSADDQSIHANNPQAEQAASDSPDAGLAGFFCIQGVFVKLRGLRQIIRCSVIIPFPTDHRT